MEYFKPKNYTRAKQSINPKSINKNVHINKAKVGENGSLHLNKKAGIIILLLPLEKRKSKRKSKRKRLFKDNILWP